MKNAVILTMGLWLVVTLPQPLVLSGADEEKPYKLVREALKSLSAAKRERAVDLINVPEVDMRADAESNQPPANRQTYASQVKPQRLAEQDSIPVGINNLVLLYP